MANSLDPTAGVWLVTVWLETLLQGCGMLQAFLYFNRQRYPKDNWWIKSTVILLMVIETLQSVVLLQGTYRHLIDNFGIFSSLEIIYWQDSAQLLATYISAFIVQMYFGYRIYSFRKRDATGSVIILPLIILILALTQIGAGIAQTALTRKIRTFSDLESMKPMTILEAASTLCCNLTITFALFNRLGKHGHKPGDSLLNTIVINAVNRGVLTVLCSAINMILFLAKPNTFYFFLGLLLSGKLYMNSTLATLNCRPSNEPTSWKLPSMSGMNSPITLVTHPIHGIHVHSTTVRFNGDTDEKVLPSQFIDFSE